MKTFKEFIKQGKKYTREEALSIGQELGIDFEEYDLEQFRMGLDVEMEHFDDLKTRVVQDYESLAKIALAHLDEDPEYYTKLLKAGL